MLIDTKNHKACIAACAVLLFTASVSFAQTPNDPLYPQQTYLSQINVQDAWAATLGNPDQKIAIIGEGNVLGDHEDLAATLVNPAVPPGSEPSTATAVGGVTSALTNNAKGIAGVNRVAPLLSYNPSKISDDPGRVHVVDIAQLGRDITDANIIS